MMQNHLKIDFRIIYFSPAAEGGGGKNH